MRSSNDQGSQASPRWQRTFYAIWGGLALSRLGSSVAQFALVWYLTDLTGSAAVLASASALALVPQILLGPLAGAYVDRWSRRVTMIISDGIIALLSLWLAILFWNGRLEIWHVYVIVMARALADCFHQPATQAATAALVPREELPRVHGLNQALGGALTVAGPPLGALALAVLQLHQVMFVDVITAALAMLALVIVRIPEPLRTLVPKTTTVWRDLRDGLRTIGGMPGMVTVIAIAVVMNLFGTPTWTLLPLYVRDVFAGGPAELGLVESAFGAGLILGGLSLTVWGKRARSRVRLAFGAFGLCGLATLGVALAPGSALWMVAACWAAFAFFNAIGNGTLMAMLQAAVPPEMQGRANAAVISLVMLATPLGLGLSAPAVARFGLRFWYLLAAVVTAAGALYALLSRDLRKMDEMLQPGAPSLAVVAESQPTGEPAPAAGQPTGD